MQENCRQVRNKLFLYDSFVGSICLIKVKQLSLLQQHLTGGNRGGQQSDALLTISELKLIGFFGSCATSSSVQHSYIAKHMIVSSLRCTSLALVTRYRQVKQQFDLKVHEAELVQARLKQSTHHHQLEEVEALQKTAGK